ncbi:MAG: GxxExxY protein [Candidatus Sumerlaeaceae bacterium]|nr:GxxExxY protein [Candidatus Sumerlaeaceae bacterium]
MNPIDITSLDDRQLAETVIALCIEVAEEIGCGHKQAIYEKALIAAFREAGLRGDRQVPVQLVYRGTPVGEFLADIIVEERIIMMVRAVRWLTNEEELQLQSILKCSEFRVGLLVNVANPKLEWKGVVDTPGQI